MENKLIPSVCIDAVFEGKSFDESCAAVKRANISAIEFWGWWDKNPDALETARKAYGLKIAAFCTKFISLVDPTCRKEYLQGLSDSIDTAKRLGTSVLISQVGDLKKDLSRIYQHQSLVDGLKEAAPLLENSGITLVIEPLNELIDHAGYFLIRSGEAFEIIEEVDSPNVKVVFDIYHQQISEGNLIRNIVSNIDKIGHFHSASNPGRNELQRGEINYREVFAAIQKTSYKGYIGLEYWPLDADPVAALKEVASWLE